MTSTSTVDYQRTDGRTLRLTFAEPDGAIRGGLVVLHEGDGVTDGVVLLVASLANEGWLTVTPHIDGGEKLTQQDLLDATDITLEWLVEHGVEADLRGVVGFDLGGTAALVVASHRRLGAAVSVGGQRVTELPRLLDIAGHVTSPWLGMYGDAGDEAGAPKWSSCAKRRRRRRWPRTSCATRAPTTASTPTRARPRKPGSARWTGSTHTCAEPVTSRDNTVSRS